MAIEEMRFRIVVDPNDPHLWAFEDTRRGQIVGGFKTAKAAQAAFERENRHEHCDPR